MPYPDLFAQFVADSSPLEDEEERKRKEEERRRRLDPFAQFVAEERDDDWRSAAIPADEERAREAGRPALELPDADLLTGLETGIERRDQALAASVPQAAAYAARTGQFFGDVNPGVAIGQAIGDKLTGGRGRENIDRQIREVEEGAAALAPQTPPAHWVQGLAEGALQSGPTSAAQMLGVLANPVLGTAALVGGEGGQMAQSARAQGAGELRARGVGLVGGGISAALERVGLDAMLGKFASGSGVRKAIAEVLSIFGVEPATEAGQEAVAAVADIAAGADPGEALQGLPERMAKAAGTAAMVSPILGPAGRIAQSAFRRGPESTARPEPATETPAAGPPADRAPRDVMYLGTGTMDKPVEVIRNPVGSDYRELSKEFTRDWPGAPKGEPKTRFAFDADGNRYIWRADKAIHTQLEPAFAAKGLEVSQMEPLPSRPQPAGRGEAATPDADAVLDDLRARDLLPPVFNEEAAPPVPEQAQVEQSGNRSGTGSGTAVLPPPSNFREKYFGVREEAAPVPFAERLQAGVDKYVTDHWVNAEDALLRRPRRAARKDLLAQGVPKREASKAAYEVGEQVHDLVKQARSQTDVALDPLFHSTRVLAGAGAQRVRDGMALLGETIGADGDSFVYTGESLHDALEGAAESDIPLLEEYIAAKKELNLARRVAGGEKLELFPDGVRDAVQRIAELDQSHPQFEAMAERWSAWSLRARLVPLLEVGALAPQEFAAIITKNPVHVPFLRAEQMADMDAFVEGLREQPSPKGARDVKLHRITRGLDPDRKIDQSPIANALEQSIVAQKFATRQRVVNALVEVSEQFPEFANEFHPVAEGMRGGDTLPVYRDGKREQWQAPHDLVTAFDGIASHMIPKALVPLTYGAQLLRAAATSAPDFTIRNPSRDFQQAYMYDRSTRVQDLLPNPKRAVESAGEALKAARAGKPTEAVQRSLDSLAEVAFAIPVAAGVPQMAPLMKPMMQAVGGLVEVVTGGKYYQEAIMNGVAQSALVSGDRPTPQTLIGDVLTAKQREGDHASVTFLKHWADEVRRAPPYAVPYRTLMTPLHMASVGMEMANRTATLRRNREAPAGRMRPEGGATELQAIRESKESGLDFSQGGSIGRVVNGVKAFFNATLLDPGKFTKAMRVAPFETTTKAFALMTIPTLINWWQWKDDEDYQNKPEWWKKGFYTLGKDENGAFWGFPRPLGIPNLLFGYLPEKVLEYAIEQDPRAVRDAVSAFIEDTPIQYLPLPGRMSEGFLAWTPTAVEPLLETHFNERIGFQPEAPIESRSMQGLPQEERFREDTPDIYKLAGQIPKQLGAEEGVSPVMLEHGTRGYLAGWGRIGANAAQAGMEAAGVVDPKAPTNRGRVPVRDAFTTRPATGSGSKPVRVFYDVWDRFDKQNASAIRKHGKRGKQLTVAQQITASEEYPLLEPDTYKRIRKGKKQLEKLQGELQDARRAADWDEVDRINRQMVGVAALALPSSEWRQ